MLLVVLPFNNKEVPLVLKNLALVKKMDGRLPNCAMLSVEEGTTDESVASVQSAAMEIFQGSSVFKYHKGPSGWPAGPNHAFKMTAWHLGATKNPFPWIWWESDAIPLCKGWLDVLESGYNAGGKPFAGHVVGGMEHMNGVGIYPPDVRAYSIRAMTAINTPWDVAMKDETRHLTTNLNHLILHYWNIHEGKNYNGPLGVPLSVKNKKELKKWITPEAVLLHRCKDGSVAEVLLK